MPVIRISKEQKETLDKYIKEEYPENVSYRIAIGDILSNISEYEYYV